MKREKENPEKSGKAIPGIRLLLVTAGVCFGLDLFHFIHHLGHDPLLLQLSGVPLKLVWKGAFFILPWVLLISSSGSTQLKLSVDNFNCRSPQC